MSKVLRASKAGFPCQRNIWYAINGSPETVSEKSQRIFDVGTALEPVIVEWLRNDGWEVEYNPGSQDAEIEVSIPVEGGTIAGHPDCIISKGEVQNALVDIKTMNERAFTYWKREGTQKAKPQYATQLHIYAMGLKAAGREISQLGIVGVNKNNSDMHIEFFPYDEFFAEDIKYMAYDLFSADEVPEFGCPTEKWACNYCEFANQCKNDNASEIVPTNDKDILNEESSAPITHDEIVINAMRVLKEARQLSKQVREMEGEAKPVLDENVKAKGLRGVQGGGLICSVKERTTTQFDTSAFKKAHPELVPQYTKSTTSTIYDIKSLKEEETIEDANG